MIAALEGSEQSAARPDRTLPPGKTRYPFYRRLGVYPRAGLDGRKISSHRDFFIVLICLHGFFLHNRARYLPTILACGHKTWNMKRERVLVKRWGRWMPLGLFSQVGAPSYSYHPVHFLDLGTTSCGLPLYITLRHCSHGIRSRTVQPVAQSLYRLSYPVHTRWG